MNGKLIRDLERRADFVCGDARKMTGEINIESQEDADLIARLAADEIVGKVWIAFSITGNDARQFNRLLNERIKKQNERDRERIKEYKAAMRKGTVRKMLEPAKARA